jgi:2-polyprenyl-6-methoxyphenol hydroxylase-like FAD-dependent oxidoreductase
VAKVSEDFVRKTLHGNIALIGDAAHTTHFSQGFGTMFAFDDALALQSALAAATDVAEALELYEATQRPKIARFQETSFAWGGSENEEQATRGKNEGRNLRSGEHRAVQRHEQRRGPGGSMPPQ